MKTFKHRNIALGCASFLVSLIVSFYLNDGFKIAILAISFSLFISLIIAYFIKKKKGILDFIIRYTPLLFFICLAMVVSLATFSQVKNEKELYDNGDCQITATVEKIEYEKPYKTRSIIEIYELDGEKSSYKMIMESAGDDLDVGDTIKATVSFVPLENSIEYSEKSAYLDNGIISMAIAEGEIEVTRGNDNLNWVEKLNYKLCNVFKSNMNKESSALFSAVVLGNRGDLSATVKRDSTRVGVSHALALSGMHITIIATLLGFLLTFVRIPRALKTVIMIFGIFFFVLLTGMSESAMRAGLMMSLYYLFKMSGKRTDSVTALFLAVTIICASYSYMIFSTSLMLSFLAMLGCLIGSTFIRRIRMRRVKIKPFKFILRSFLVTLFVFLFTLPIVSSVFGTFSLLTPISNLILVPLFALIMYLGTAILAFSGIPYLSNALFFAGEKLAGLLLKIIDKLASLDGIVVSIYSALQIVGVVLIVLALVFLLASKRKRSKITICAVSFSVLFFAFGCLFNYVDKANNVYISAYNYKTSDFVAIESKNELTLIDVSEATTGVANHTIGFVDKLNATEIENYIMTDYSSKANYYFKSVSENVKINNLYLCAPTDDEKEIYNEIVNVAKNDEINVLALEKQVELSGVTVDFSPINTLSRSKKRSVSFNISVGDIDFLYLGAGSYEIFDYFADNMSKMADTIVFGSHGPSYQEPYKYEIPYAQNAIYYGSARHYAEWDLIKATQEIEIKADEEPIKFKLKK